MSALQIKQIPVLQDNYTYLVHDQQSGQSLVVDPALSQPVLDRAAALGWNINWIINTHHHPDHVDGNLAIKHQTGCQIVGPRADSARIPGIDQLVGDGDTFRLGERKATVLDIPGHTKGHIAYAFCADKALFSGDTIFVLGCGRMFEGTARQMWQSLLKLRALDDDMRVFCAHEYSEENARFATALEPHNRQIQIRAQHIRVLRNQGKATIPSLLGEEKQTNPFLRADDPDLAALIGMASRPAHECFGELRKRKDQF